jgi:hypothetical protein
MKPSACLLRRNKSGARQNLEGVNTTNRGIGLPNHGAVPLDLKHIILIS